MRPDQTGHLVMSTLHSGSAPETVTDNGCAFTNVGVLGGPCSDCTTSYCVIDANGTVLTICNGGGFGPGPGNSSYPGGRATCAATTIYH